jgi:hypothetical protein
MLIADGKETDYGAWYVGRVGTTCPNPESPLAV